MQAVPVVLRLCLWRTLCALDATVIVTYFLQVTALYTPVQVNMGKTRSARRRYQQAERDAAAQRKAGPKGKGRKRDDKQQSIKTFFKRSDNPDSATSSRQSSSGSEPSTPRSSPSSPPSSQPSPNPQPKKRFVYNERLVANWKKDFHWLEVEETSDGELVMKCVDCVGMSNVPTNAFAHRGSTNFQRSAVEGHDQSGEHARCQRQRANAAYQPGSFVPALKRQILKTEKEILNLLSLAYFIGKEEIAIDK